MCEHYGEIEKSNYEILRNVVLNAGLNLLRKKGDSEIPLFDENQVVETLETIDVEARRKERDELFASLR